MDGEQKRNKRIKAKIALFFISAILVFAFAGSAALGLYGFIRYLRPAEKPLFHFDREQVHEITFNNETTWKDVKYQDTESIQNILDRLETFRYHFKKPLGSPKLGQTPGDVVWIMYADESYRFEFFFEHPSGTVWIDDYGYYSNIDDMSAFLSWLTEMSAAGNIP